MRFDPDEPSFHDERTRLHSQAATAKAALLARAALGIEEPTPGISRRERLDSILVRLTNVGPSERVRMVEIADAVASAYGVTVEGMKGKTRSKILVRARQHAFYLMYTYLEHVSMPMIGAFFDRDHSTIHHGINAHMAREEALL